MPATDNHGPRSLLESYTPASLDCTTDTYEEWRVHCQEREDTTYGLQDDSEDDMSDGGESGSVSE